MNYEKDLKISEDDLDLECLEQASLFMKYAKHSADTLRDLDDVKQKLDVLKADLDRQIREKPSDYNIEKVTEGAIQSAILVEPSYQKMYEELLNAKYENDLARSAVTAMNIRKEMLEGLLKLHGQSYFASPKVPRNLSEEREAKEKKTDAGVASRLIRRTK